MMNNAMQREVGNVATSTVKTGDLTGVALNWAVARARYSVHCDAVLSGYTMIGWWATGAYPDPNIWIRLTDFKPSESWAQGGPIIEQEDISIVRCDADYQNFPDKWMAERGANSYCESTEHQQHEAMIQFAVRNNGSSFAKDGPFYGPTPLVAAMRCFVASRLGDKVEIPKGLL